MIRTFWYDHLVGTPIERALLVRRRSPDWLAAGVVFIHIPKAAGTSVSEALYGRFLGHLGASDVRRWGSRAVNALPFIAVARNPWDRLVSAYRFARRGTGIGGVRTGAIWRPEQYRVKECDRFDTFVRDWLLPRDPRRLDPVFQPQSPFVFASDGTSLVDYIGRFEDLGATFEFLHERFPHVQPIAQANRSGPAIDYRSFYSPQLVDLVGSIYAEDVRRFGYSFE